MNDPEGEGVFFPISNYGNIHAAFDELRKWKSRSPLDRCLWWRTRCNEPIGSHSLSKCWLRTIAPEGNAVVLRLNADKVGKQPTSFKDQLDGVNRISVFKGFCSEHDNDLFLPIDSLAFELSNDNCSRVSYRSVCHNACSKFAATGAFLQTPGVFGSDQPTKLDEQTYMMMCQFFELLSLKQAYEAGFDNREVRFPVEHEVLVFDIRIPFCGTASFRPYVTATGRSLKPDKSWMTITVLPSKSGSMAILSTDRQHPKNGNLITKSFNSIQDVHLADTLLRFMIEHGENLAFDPVWWRSLTEGQKSDLRRLAFRSIRFGSETPPANLFHTNGKSIIRCSGASRITVR
jgi:hypothetical protein